MTEMYLLFEWTEERESKMHIGIFSTKEKAKRAAELSWHGYLRNRGAEDHELTGIVWDETDESLVGMKIQSDDEDLQDIDDEQPFDIEKFEVDVLEQTVYGNSSEPTEERHEL